ncbi:hypothetical protein [Nocardioides sp. BYT-33-1]|uniref:hypothetical protein n=1 Tax=Nocardioides sp. BYT-33-1 TaxID=3416952 RepID=UPI003F53AB31
MTDHIESVRVVASCPNCGTRGYEIDFEPDDIASGAEISFPCDECPKRITVSVDVLLQSAEATR